MTNVFSTRPVIVRENLPTTAITFTRRYGNKHLTRPAKFAQPTIGA
jgi:hypothetical protein